MPELPFDLSAPLDNPGITTLGGIRATVRSRSDMVNSQFITDLEFNGWINSSYLELYDLLLSAYGSDYFVAPTTNITTDGVNDQYALPEDFYKLLGVDLCQNSNPQFRISLKPFAFSERNRYASPNVPMLRLGAALQYRLLGNNLWLRPMPSAGQTITLWYAPRLLILSGDTDTADLVSGWEEYIIVDCVIKAKLKEESECSVELALKQALLKRIQDISQDRDIGAPTTVADTSHSNYSGFGGWNPGGGGDW